MTDQRLAVKFSTDVSARYDNNVYLSDANKVGETTLSATPGVTLRWGQDARSGGNLAVAESFNRYTRHTSPNVALATAALNAGYQGAASAVTAGASYQQLNQSNTDVPGQNARVRTNVSAANAAVEASPLVKVGGRLGFNYADTDYRTGNLTSNRQLGLPFDVLFHVTPKTDLSVGYVYGTQRPEGGDRSKDHYFNVGARGDFTAKLSGTFNVGYQSRQVAGRPAQHQAAFNGTFNYELTPKTALNIVLNRNFNASAQGQSTKNTAFRLGIDTNVSPQWRLGAHAAYLDNQYGLSLLPGIPVAQERTDHLWEGDLGATYQVSEWFSTSLTYFLRRNNSSVPLVDFTGNIVNFTLGFRF